MIRVYLEDKNEYIYFPENMSEGEIQKVLDEHYGLSREPSIKPVMPSKNLAPGPSKRIMPAKRYKPWEIPAAFGEAALGLATGALAFPVGMAAETGALISHFLPKKGLTGPKTMPGPEGISFEIQPPEARKEVSKTPYERRLEIEQALTYEPRTKAGQELLSKLAYPFELVFTPASKAREYAEKIGGPIAGSIAGLGSEILTMGALSVGGRAIRAGRLYLEAKEAVSPLLASVAEKIPDKRQRRLFIVDTYLEAKKRKISVDDVIREKLAQAEGKPEAKVKTYEEKPKEAKTEEPVIKEEQIRETPIEQNVKVEIEGKEIYPTLVNLSPQVKLEPNQPSFAIMTKNGSIIFDPAAKTHLEVFEKSGLPEERIYRTGFVKNGKFEASTEPTRILKPEIEKTEEKAPATKPITEEIIQEKTPIYHPSAYYNVGEYKPSVKPRLFELPELVELAEDLLQGKYPDVVKKIKSGLGSASGAFYPRTEKIKIQADVFANREVAAWTLAHEIGHVVDYLPDKILSRGNILGRIASLKKYLKEFIEAIPETAEEFANKVEKTDYIKKVRQEWRKEAEKEARKILGRGRSKDDYTFNKRFSGLVSELYKKKKIAWFKENNFVTKQEIMDELKKLTKTIKPFDESLNAEYTKYRYSSKELYADALSTLLNAPNLLADYAPKFYNSFFAYLDRKPELKTTYNEILNYYKNADIYKHRKERIAAGFAEAEEKWRKAIEPSQYEDTFLRSFKNVLYDKFKSAIELTADSEARFKIEDYIYRSAEQSYYLNEVYNSVYKTIKDIDPKIHNFEFFKFLKTIEGGGRLKNKIKTDILGEKYVVTEEIANSYGIQMKDAAEMLKAFKHDVGPENYAIYESALKNYWQNRQYVIRRLDEAKLLSPELMQYIKNNEYYSHFQVVDYMTDKWGPGISSHIFPKEGTLKKVAPVFTATLIKDLQLLNAVNYKNAAKAVCESLLKKHPDLIKPAEYRFNGYAKVPVESNIKGLSLLAYPEEGRLIGYYVPDAIASAFRSSTPTWLAWIQRFLDRITNPFRAIFINYNPGFWLFNINRDFNSAFLTLPKADLARLSYYWFESVMPAFKGIFKYDKLTQELLKQKSLIPSFDRYGFMPEDIQFERMIRAFGIDKGKPENVAIRALDAFLAYANDFAASLERIPKIMAHNYLENRFPQMSSQERAYYIRRAGSPPFLIKGYAYPILNNVFLFSNAFMQAVRMHWKAFKDNPAEYAWKQVQINLIPKMIMWAAQNGLFDEINPDIREIMEKSSDYDKTNYLVIPLGLTESGKAVILRKPLDDQSRFLGGIFWKFLTGIKDPEDIVKVFDYTHDQFPGFNPVFRVIYDIVKFLTGVNPDDRFFDDTVIKARNLKTLSEFAKYLANNMGSHIVYRFKKDDIEGIKTELEELLDYPFVNNILGRFLKIYERGISDEIREEKVRIQRELARVNLEVRSALKKIATGKNEPLTQEEVEALSLKVAKGQDSALLRNIIKLMAHRGGTEGMIYLDEYLKAQTKEEKMAIIKIMAEKYNRTKGGVK